MAVTYVGGDTSSSTSSVTSRTLTIPTVQDDDLAILVFVHSTSAASAPAGWTLLNAHSSGSTWGEVFYRWLYAADAGTTVTVTAPSSQRPSATLSVYRGASALAVANSGATSAATSHPVPSVTAPAGGAVAVSAIVERSSSPSTVFTAPASYTRRSHSYGDGGGACSSGVADYLGATVAEGDPVGSGSWTAEALAVAITWSIALVPAVAAPLSGTLTLEPTSGYAPLSVTATAITTGGTGSPKEYDFEWGDGASTGWQSSNIATHVYVAPGEYTEASENPVQCHVRNI